MTNYDPRRQPALVILVIGAILGLILGLLIGWVFWPVEWTGGSLRDLNSVEKAEYIAAVADAFAIYDSPEAAAVAQRRLAPLDDGNLAQSFQETLTYFSTSQFTDRAIRDSNIRRLAVALNLSSASAAPAPQELAGNAAEPIATTAPTVVTALPATESSGGLGWLGWLLWLVTALLLVGGGVYILNRTGLAELQTLFKRPAPVADGGIDEFDDQPADQPRRGRSGNLITAEPEGAYSFDQEDDDQWGASGAAAPQQARRTDPRRDDPRHDDPRRDDTPYQRPTAQVYDTAYDEEDDDNRLPPRHNRGLTDDDLLEEDEIDEGYLDVHTDDDLTEVPFDEDEDDGLPPGPGGRPGGSWRPASTSYTIDVAADDAGFGAKGESLSERSRPIPPAPPVEPRPTEPRPLPERKTPGSDSGQPSAVLTSAAFTPSRQPATSVVSQRAPVAPPTRSRAAVIDQHTFQYQMGIAEYDESRPIVDPQTGKYIGEFGMGASSKNGLAQVGADQLVALEVWLFDKADERNLGNQTRILLSEYAIDHNLEQAFLKERQDNPRPFTAQRNVTFQLESQNLLLNCLIVDVKYSTNPATKGIFEQIKVDMTVQKK